MSAGQEDVATIADAVETYMCSHVSVLDGDEPWEVLGLDIGEVEITTHTGQRFRLTVEEIGEDE